MSSASSSPLRRHAYSPNYSFRDDLDPNFDILYHPRSLSVLFVIISYFLYVTFVKIQVGDIFKNSFSGLISVFSVFFCIGLLYLPDGPFIRPHPIVWRGVLSISILYFLGLVFVLHLSKDEARQLLKLFDSSLGVELPEKSYAEDCSLSLSALLPKLDEFVLAHIVGWYAKALILRDYWLCWILSVMFEVMEYSLQFQLPNFAECWWDHWILDVALCNALGIWAGMKTCEFFSMKTYQWRSIKNISSFAGKMRRTIEQFTPHSLLRFDWAGTKTFKGYLVSILVLSIFLICELNCFYLKYLLWVPPAHYINVVRLVLYGLIGIVAAREAYQFFTDPSCNRLGAQAWICLASILTETLICFKFGQGEFPNPAPKNVIYFWTCFILLLFLYPLLKFWLIANSPVGESLSTGKPMPKSQQHK